MCGIGLSQNWFSHFRTKHKRIPPKEIEEIEKEVQENKRALEELEPIGVDIIQGLKVLKASKCPSCNQVFSSFEYCLKHTKTHQPYEEPKLCWAQEIKHQTFIEVILIFLSYF